MTWDFGPLVLTLKTSITATVITFFLGIYAAKFVMGANPRLKWLLDGIFALPLVLPPTVIGFFLLLLVGKNSPIGQFFLNFNIRLVFSWPGAVLCATVVSFPLMYRTARGAFEQMDINIIYAARTLGLSEFKIFWQIVLPACLPGVIAGTVLSFARAMGEFGATLMVAGNIPGKTQTVSLLIYTAVAGNDMALAMKWVMVIVAISLGSIGLVNIWTNRRAVSVKAGENL